MALGHSWSLLPGANPALRCWSDGCIAYHPLSGDTHVLSVEAGALLELVMHGPSAASQLLPRMRDRFPACDALTLDTWLDELAAVRLIAPAPCN